MTIISLYHVQNRACWCPGNWRCQAISRHDINLRWRVHTNLSTARVKTWPISYSWKFHTRSSIHCSKQKLYDYLTARSLNTLNRLNIFGIILPHDTCYYTLKLEQSCRRSADGILEYIFLEWKCFNFDWNFGYDIHYGLIYKKSTMVKVMAWCQVGDSHYLNQC